MDIVCETFLPVTTQLDFGKDHPGQIVETAALQSVELPPITYKSVRDKTVLLDSFSRIQLEAIYAACQRHEIRLPNGSRAGFCNGYGTGVGKGRCCVGVIGENFARGRKKAIWISPSNELIENVRKDLAATGMADCPVLLQTSINAGIAIGLDIGVVFTTYAALAKSKDRQQQLMKWAGGSAFDGVIILDECHKAKSAREQTDPPNQQRNNSGRTKQKGTKTGAFILEMQRELPDARVVYSSATGATEIKDMAYMDRLGIWGQGCDFENFDDFTREISKSGVCAMELVAIDLKKRGAYLARQLSMDGVKFQFKVTAISDKKKSLYNDVVSLVKDIRITHSKLLAIAGPSVGEESSKVIAGQIQTLLKVLCVDVKIDECLQIIQEKRKDCAIVVGLQSTGESAQLISANGTDPQFSSPALRSLKLILEQMESIRPAVVTGDQELALWTHRCEAAGLKSGDITVLSIAQRQALVAKMCRDFGQRIESLAPELPIAALDRLINEAGGPNHVAEMTGRACRLVVENQQVRFQSRKRTKTSDPILDDCEAFNNGQKDVIVISEKSSCGVSLHCDRGRPHHQKKRLHICIETAWSADKALQQWGRTHRSNQLHAPEYLTLISPVAGEVRFVAALVARVKSLAAITHSDRRAKDGFDFSAYDFEPALVENALRRMHVNLNATLTSTTVPHRTMEQKSRIRDVLCESFSGFQRATWTAAMPKIETFFNEMLTMRIEDQELVYGYFMDVMKIVTQEAQANQVLDAGADEIGADDDPVKLIRVLSYAHPKDPSCQTMIFTVEFDRGIPFDKAMQVFQQRAAMDKRGGFYVDNMGNDMPFVQLLLPRDSEAMFFDVYRPNSGHQGTVPVASVKECGIRLDETIAEMFWTVLYESALSRCTHILKGSICPSADCRQGGRMHQIHILGGSILPIWKVLSSVLAGRSERLETVRAILSGKRRIMGVRVSGASIEPLMAALQPILGSPRDLTDRFNTWLPPSTKTAEYCATDVDVELTVPTDLSKDFDPSASSLPKSDEAAARDAEYEDFIECFQPHIACYIHVARC